MDTSLSPEEQDIAERITQLKQQLGDDLLILGHHYQRDSIVMHADFLGDSFMLSQKAAESTAKYIVFCGVHFMAESADILTSDEQTVVLPNMRAGCSMADMAQIEDVKDCWDDLNEIVSEESKIIPITYMNSTAAIKFCIVFHCRI
jgi:quinolinate synthase